MAFPGAVIVVVTEANMSYTGADRIGAFFSQPYMRPSFVLSRDESGRGRPGVWTTDVEKELYCRDMERILATNSLRRAKTLVTIAPDGKDARAPEKQWLKLVQQLGMFRRTVKAPQDDVFQRSRLAFSGKGGGNKDDMVMALMMAAYWTTDVRRDPRFREEARAQGWQLD